MDSRIQPYTASILALSVALLSACSFGAISYKTETLTAIGVKLDKPQQWSTARTESGDSYVDYIIDVPEGNETKNGIAGRVSVNLVRPLPGEAVKLDDEINGLKKLFSGSIAEMKVLEEVDATLLGTPGKRVVLQFRNNEDKTTLEKAIFTVTVKDNKAYVILFDDDANDFQKYLPVYEKMAASMQSL